jgi:hypothetical protein
MSQINSVAANSYWPAIIYLRFEGGAVRAIGGKSVTVGCGARTLACPSRAEYLLTVQGRRARALVVLCATARTNSCQDFVRCEMGHTRSYACWTELTWEVSVTSRRKTHRARPLASNVQPMETTMQKTALTILGALLISGAAIQIAAASEQHHHVTKANYSRHNQADFRGAYNQVRPVNVSVTPPAVYRTEEGFRLPDPSWIGGQDPSLNPAD